MSVNPQRAKGAIPNLINGISQQPANIRFPSQADTCLNMMPNIQEQCGKRNPLETLFTTNLSITTDSYVHWYRRDNSEAYTVVLNGSTIQIRSIIDGTAKTVTMSQPGGDVYHQSLTPLDSFFLYTYKDTTFVVNRNIICAMQSTLSPGNATAVALLKIKDASTGYIYKTSIKLSGVTYSTPTYTAVGGDTVNTVATNLAASITAAAIPGLTVTVQNNIIFLSAAVTQPNLTLTSSDNRNGTAIFSFTDNLSKVADLPGYAPDGYYVLVTGSTSTGNSQDQNVYDDVWYKFKADITGAFGSGVWIETLAPGTQFAYDASLMPHKLVRNSDGTFTYSQITWDNRLVGDAITNPNPSFIGNTIHSCGLDYNRFVLATAGEPIGSRVDEANYFNFWRTTMVTSLDTDPIRLPVPSSQVNKIYYTIPWNDNLMLFGDRLDGAVSFTGAFAPNKISINTPTNFGISPLTPPRVSGGSLFFPKNQGNYSIIYEYALNPVTNQKDADNLTAYCASFIPKDVYRVEGTVKELLFFATRGQRDTLYNYSYAKKNATYTQQAFHNWNFPGATIYSFFVELGTMYVLYGLLGKVFIGSLDISVGAQDMNLPTKCRLDYRIPQNYPGVTTTYNAGTNRTTVFIPHDISVSDIQIELSNTFTSGSDVYPAGKIIQIESQTAFGAGRNLVLVDNWVGSSFFVGVLYNAIYDPCEFKTYGPNADGTGTVVDTWKKIIVQRVNLSYNNTASYTIQLLNRSTGAVIHSEDMEILFDNEVTDFNNYKLYSGSKVHHLKFDPAIVKLRLLNRTSRPSYFTGLAWTGEFKSAEI